MSAEAATRRVNAEYCSSGATCWQSGTDRCDRIDLYYRSLLEADSCTETGDRIVIQCDKPQGSYCDYAPYDFFGAAFGRTRTSVTVAADPVRSVRFRRASASFPRQADGGVVVPYVIGVSSGADNWEFDGLVVDARADDVILDATSSGAVVTTGHAAVLLTDHGISWRNGIVENSVRDCIQVNNNNFSPQRVTIEGNTIRHCIHWSDPAYSRQQNAQGEPLRYLPDGGAYYPDGGIRQGKVYFDSNGVYTFTAAGLVVKDNVIHHTSGDGVQLDIDDGAGVPGSWANVTITGNHIYTSPLSTLNGTSPGENGVDAKPGVGPVDVRGNTVHGFRGFIYPTGKGTGSDHGVALLVHGRFTGCGAALSDGGVSHCARFEGNDVSDSNMGIGVGNNKLHSFNNVAGGSAPKGVFILRNVVHDMSSDTPAPTGYQLQRRGAGIGVALSDDPNNVAHQYLEHIVVEHNTIANVPGVGLFQSADPSWCDNASCVANHNLIDNAGEKCSPLKDVLVPALNMCTGATASNGPGCTEFEPDAIFEARLPYSGVSACGENTTPPCAATGYDYSVAATSPAVEYPGADRFGVYCGSMSDIGAKEFCAATDPAFPGGKLILDIDPTTRSLRLGAVDYFRLHSSFTTGLGAYGNTLTFTSPELPGSNCHAGSGATYDNCVFSTGSCERSCTPGRINGELNCACLPTQRRSFGTPSPMATNVVGASIDIDQNGDGKRDDSRSASAFADYFRLSELHGQLAFEDFATPKAAGDRDDFIADVVAVECNKRGASTVNNVSELMPLPACSDDLVCEPCSKSLPPSPVRVDAKILVDGQASAENGPSEGRSLHIGVTVKSNLSAGEELRYAVCPVVAMRDQVVDVTEYLYSTRPPVGGCEEGMSRAGHFECNVLSPKVDVPATIAFARFQSTDNAAGGAICSPQNEADDLQVITGDMRCGGIAIPAVATSNFRVRLADVDNVFGTSLHSALHQDIAPALSELRVYVVTGIKAGEFYCPSGFNADVWKVDPAVGNISVVRWNDATSPLLHQLVVERKP